MTPLGSLIGARVRRIDAPKPGLLCVGLYGRELKATLVFCVGEKSSGVGLVASRPHGDAADSFVLKLRKELDNARITALSTFAPGVLGLSLQRLESAFELECHFGDARLALRAGETTLASHSWPRTGAARSFPEWPESVDELADAGPRLLAESAADALAAERSALSRALRSTQKRLERRLAALAQDIDRAQEVEALRTRANLLLTQQQRVKRGETSVRVVDYSLDPPQQVEIALDPARTTKEQIEAWFKQAKRFERGAQLAREREAMTQRDIAQLEQLRSQLTAADAGALVELTKAARTLGVRGISLGKVGPSDKPQVQRHKAYRELRGYKERTILVGKGAADNDVLTREHARPQDLWLHARNVAGAHVVVPLERNETCPQELLLDAAHLAAHFSDARSERVVDVSYTPKRFVRKPRGAPAGQVLLDREKVLTLHLDPQRLAALLKTELA
jgi:predicted ribosome quality control (RQC) complex YloA/Tae2 family protein